MREGNEARIALAAAIQDLYRVFAAYPADPTMGYCDHCITAEEVARLFEVPLSDLTARALSRYTGKAMTTWGEMADFKHFLPRVLELAAADEPMFINEISLVAKFQ